MQEGHEVGKGEGGKEGEVSLERSKKKVEDVGLGGLRMEVGTVRVLRDSLVCKGKDPIDVVKAIGVDAPTLR